MIVPMLSVKSKGAPAVPAEAEGLTTLSRKTEAGSKGREILLGVLYVLGVDSKSSVSHRTSGLFSGSTLLTLPEQRTPTRPTKSSFVGSSSCKQYHGCKFQRQRMKDKKKK
jgi:hypothetical protein